jgi:hypothetical protein
LDSHQAHALDGGIPSLFHTKDHWPAASDVRRGGRIVLVLPVILGVLLVACTGEPVCDVMSEKDTPSPDGRYIASIFEVFCDNTTGRKNPLIEHLHSGVIKHV